MSEVKFEYTHYAGLWQPVEPRPREAYCDACGAETLMPAARCGTCGQQIADVFLLQHRADATSVGLT